MGNIDAQKETTHGNQQSERSVFRITETVRYCCQWCGSGAETFKEAFPDGCAQCGAPAKEYDKETVVKELNDLDKSFFVVYADDEKQKAGNFVSKLTKGGAKVVTLEDVLPNGLATNQISSVLEKVAVTVPWVVFIPSAQLDKETKDDFVLDIVMNETLRTGSRKTFAAYIDQEHIKHAPRMLRGLYGVMLDNSDDKSGVSSDIFFESHLPGMIDELR